MARKLTVFESFKMKFFNPDGTSFLGVVLPDVYPIQYGYVELGLEDGRSVTAYYQSLYAHKDVIAVE